MFGTQFGAIQAKTITPGFSCKLLQVNAETRLKVLSLMLRLTCYRSKLLNFQFPIILIPFGDNRSKTVHSRFGAQRSALRLSAESGQPTTGESSVSDIMMFGTQFGAIQAKTITPGFSCKLLQVTAETWLKVLSLMLRLTCYRSKLLNFQFPIILSWFGDNETKNVYSRYFSTPGYSRLFSTPGFSRLGQVSPGILSPAILTSQIERRKWYQKKAFLLGIERRF